MSPPQRPESFVRKIAVPMEMLRHPHVFIKNHDKVKTIINSLLSCDLKDLQIIADFDQTMTKSENKGKKTHSSFGILENSSLMPESIREEARKNTSHYHPIEMDTSIPAKEKIPLMIEWYQKNMHLIIKAGYQQTDFGKMVKESNAILRDRCDEVLKLANEHHIPMLIISAGLGDMILEVLKQQSEIYPNIKVISNFMAFNDKGFANDIHGKLLHTFNKETAPLQDPEYFKKLDQCKHVIMLGDSPGDPDMVLHLSDQHNILKIGFLNANVEKSLPVYQDLYDVVITKDQTWDILLNILKAIIK